MSLVTEYHETLLIRVGADFAKLHTRIFEPINPKGVVFYVHDITGNGADFAQAAAMVSANGYTVICPDLPGHGKSAYLRPQQYSVPTYVQMLSAICKKYSGTCNILIGAGWGSMIAAVFAATSAVRFQKFIALDMPVTWSLNSDAEIQAAVLEANMVFEKQSDAITYLQSKPGFKRLRSRSQIKYLNGRIEEVSDRFKFSFDANALQFHGINRNKIFEIPSIMGNVTADLVFLYGAGLPPASEKALRALNTPDRIVTLIKNTTNCGKLHMNELSQIVLVLGCMA